MCRLRDASSQQLVTSRMPLLCRLHTYRKKFPRKERRHIFPGPISFLASGSYDGLHSRGTQLVRERLSAWKMLHTGNDTRHVRACLISSLGSSSYLIPGTCCASPCPGAVKGLPTTEMKYESCAKNNSRTRVCRITMIVRLKLMLMRLERP